MIESLVTSYTSGSLECDNSRGKLPKALTTQLHTLAGEHKRGKGIMKQYYLYYNNKNHPCDSYEAMNMEALYLRMMGYKVETVIIGSEEE